MKQMKTKTKMKMRWITTKRITKTRTAKVRTMKMRIFVQTRSATRGRQGLRKR